MTDLEKRAEEYLKAKWGTNKMLILGGDARKVLADFAQYETALLSQHILDLQKDKGKLTDENRELKILISSLVYEINQIWDINEMNDDLRRSAEKIDREVQLSKMAEDNRMVISALGFAVVPPKPKVDVKEI